MALIAVMLNEMYRRKPCVRVPPVHPHARRPPPPHPQKGRNKPGRDPLPGWYESQFQGDGGKLMVAQAEHKRHSARGGHGGVLAPQPKPGEEACGTGCHHQAPARPGQEPAAVLPGFLPKRIWKFLNLPKLNSEETRTLPADASRGRTGRAASSHCSTPTAGNTSPT